MGSIFGNSSPAPQITSYQPSIPTSPLQSQINNQAQQGLNQQSAFSMSPYRPVDYLAGLQSPQSFTPQMTSAPAQGQSSIPGVPGAANSPGNGVPGASAPNNAMAGLGQWWNQTQQVSPTTQAGMAQNVQPSLAALGQLLGKGAPNPRPTALGQLLGKGAPNPQPTAGGAAANAGPNQGQPPLAQGQSGYPSNPQGPTAATGTKTPTGGQGVG